MRVRRDCNEIFAGSEDGQRFLRSARRPHQQIHTTYFSLALKGTLRRPFCLQIVNTQYCLFTMPRTCDIACSTDTQTKDKEVGAMTAPKTAIINRCGQVAVIRPFVANSGLGGDVFRDRPTAATPTVTRSHATETVIP